MKTYRFKIEWYDDMTNKEVEDRGWVCGECYSDAVENISKLYRVPKDNDKEKFILSISLYQTDNSHSVVLDDDVLNTIEAEERNERAGKE